MEVKVMELITGEWTRLLVLVSIIAAAVSLVGICWILWRQSLMSIVLIRRATDVGDELRSMDSRLTDIAKSLISIEGLLEREQSIAKNPESAGVEVSGSRRKLFTK
jgi:hypothetical protein